MPTRTCFCFFALCLLAFDATAQLTDDPSARKPYRAVVQTGIALQWFEEEFKCFTLSAEKPLNLYNHVGLQANFFFPNGSYYQNITGKSYEVGVFAKCFFHGRLTGRRSNAYWGPDFRLGRRQYLSYDSFSQEVTQSSTTLKFMARVGWQYHFGIAVLEFALPFGVEKENFSDQYISSSGIYYYISDDSQFVAAPILSLGIGF